MLMFVRLVQVCLVRALIFKKISFWLRQELRKSLCVSIRPSVCDIFEFFTLFSCNLYAIFMQSSCSLLSSLLAVSSQIVFSQSRP